MITREGHAATRVLDGFDAPARSGRKLARMTVVILPG
jgi:hypothetical protein